jgi:pimeloyl-ACP methyl ester carboxylesterase
VFRYWDPERRAGTNSYVNAALEAGYSILVYDRLGVGRSDKPDAYEILQAPVEVEVLHQLTSLARSGQLFSPTQAHQGVKIPKFDKIVLVGHSFGTAITSGVVSKYGGTIDGAVLTAFVLNKEFSATGIDSFGWEYAPQNDRKRFGSFSSGRLVQGTVSNVQQIFMKKGAFELDMLDYAEEVKQPGAAGEFLSIGTIWPLPAPAFTGPVLVSLDPNFQSMFDELADQISDSPCRIRLPNLRWQLCWRY